MASDLSQSLDLSICQYREYILLISTADRVDLVFPYLFMIADRCIYDIGSKDQINWHAHTPEGEFWTCTGVKQISQAAVFDFHINTHALLSREVFVCPRSTSILDLVSQVLIGATASDSHEWMMAWLLMMNEFLDVVLGMLKGCYRLGCVLCVDALGMLTWVLVIPRVLLRELLSNSQFVLHLS
uniref:Uncharacterized protein n=1 Tax=Oryza sativa subsp. japonica TaxID=39947 RepID=Q2R004_ORYSJ|nr:hypothetical protein LOC_Os11g44220 [Oryza sativa Japonica Group]